MGLLLVTILVYGLAIFVGASLLQWIFRKITPKVMASLGLVGTVAIVAVTTAVYMYVMTRPAIIGPYEQFTFENIGGQVIAGVLVAGSMVWIGSRAESSTEAPETPSVDTG